jgi:multicomponent K+:H+ antiporter subunit F
MILDYAVSTSIALIALALVMNLVRMINGPRTLDRVVAMDTMYINAIAMIVLFGIHLDSFLYFEAALLIAMMGFLGTVALSKYFLRGDIIE